MSSRRHSRGRATRTWGTGTVLAAALLAILTACGGSGSEVNGGSPSGSADYVIDATGYESTRTALEAAGWVCFDTIEEPSPVRRCYLDALTGDPSGSVTFRFFDADFVGYINVALEGRDGAAVGAVRDAVTMAIGDGLLGGAGPDLAAAARAGQPTQVAGVRLDIRDPTHFEVIDPAYQEVPFETDILPPLPELDEVRPQLEQRGFTCVEGDSPPGTPSRSTDCQGVIGELMFDVWVSLAGRQYEADDWRVSVIELSDGSTGQQRVDGVAALFQELGIIGDQAAAVIRGGLRPQGLNADVEGHHVSVGPYDPAFDGVVAVNVDRRLASEINS